MALTTVKTSALSGNINLTSQVTGALPTANGGTGATSFSPGKILQVVQATHGTQTSNNSSSYQASGLTANITPSATSSKILIQHQLPFYQDGNGGSIISCIHALFKGGSNLNEYGSAWGMTSRSINYAYQGVGFYRDAPNTTSQLTYDIRYKPYDTGEGQIIYSCPDSTYGGLGADSQATLILMEIGA